MAYSLPQRSQLLNLSALADGDLSPLEVPTLEPVHLFGQDVLHVQFLPLIGFECSTGSVKHSLLYSHVTPFISVDRSRVLLYPF